MRIKASTELVAPAVAALTPLQTPYITEPAENTRKVATRAKVSIYLVIYKARVQLTCGHCVKLVEADSSIEMDEDAAAGVVTCEK